MDYLKDRENRNVLMEIVANAQASTGERAHAVAEIAAKYGCECLVLPLGKITDAKDVLIRLMSTAPESAIDVLDALNRYSINPVIVKMAGRMIEALERSGKAQRPSAMQQEETGITRLALQYIRLAEQQRKASALAKKIHAKRRCAAQRATV
jgi:hypothetical protein